MCVWGGGMGGIVDSYNIGWFSAFFYIKKKEVIFQNVMALCFRFDGFLFKQYLIVLNMAVSQNVCCISLSRYSYRDSYPQTRGDDRGDGYSRGATSRGEYPPPRSDMRDSPRDSYGTRGADGYSALSSRDYREPLSSRGGDRFDRWVHTGSFSSVLRWGGGSLECQYVRVLWDCIDFGPVFTKRL